MSEAFGAPRRWVLEALFADDGVAITTASAVAARADALAEAAPKLLAEGRIAKFIDELADVEAGLAEAAEYVSMRQYADGADESVHVVGVGVRTAVVAGTAAVERALDAWRALPESRVDELLGDDGSAAAAYRLRRVRETAAHRADPSLEAVWAMRTATARDGWASLHELVEAQTRVRFDDGSGEREWGIGDLGMVLRHPEAPLRRSAWAAFAEAYDGDRDVVATAWDAVVADRLAEDRFRGRAHPAAATLEEDDLPLDGFSSLLEAVEGRRETLQTLLSDQATQLGLGRLAAADMDAQLPGLPQLGYGEVARVALSGLRELDPVLESDARKLFALERIDAETRPGKQPYAVTFNTRLDPPAFVAFRAAGQAASVLTLGHELGHAVALARCAAAQPPIARGWPGVLFEVPSLLAEIATADALVDAYPEHLDVIRLTLSQVLVWSVFEGMTFCRVELDLYERRDRGEALTAGVITDAFEHRFGETYGPAMSVTTTDAAVLAGMKAGYAIGFRFYGFQYAIGALVALAALGVRRTDPEGFGQRCVELFARGRSVAPSAQLVPFGLDLGPATWNAGLDELELLFGVTTRQTPGG
jgi:oligoendopeptidase F